MQSTSPSIRSSMIKSATLLCALALLGSNAWSAAVENSKPKNRLAAKAAPQAAADTLVEDDSPISEEQLALAPNVNSGDAQCEFKSTVSVTPHPEKPGRFRLQFGKMVYDMTPEPTSTGAVRLENKKAGVVWLQIPAKSMLMNTKVGQRMVDSCMHSTQVSEAQSAALAAARDEASGTAAAPSGLGITPDAAAAAANTAAPVAKMAKSGKK